MGMFMHRKSKKVLECLVAAWVVCMGAGPVYAADPAPQAYKIEPQSVSTALKEFAAQSNLQLIFTEADVGSVKTNGVSGTKAPREALSEILRGTGLKFEFTANNVVVVKRSVREAKSDPPSGADRNTEEKGGKTDSSQDFRVAQVDQNAAGPQAIDKNKGEESDSKRKTAGLEEIVVTGSRIPTVAGNEVQPVRSYTREDIENGGQITLGDFLNTLPDVSSNNPLQTGFSGQQAVQLHGLPVGTTLTLLDGRRLDANIGGFFDLSNIPLAAVERVEILPVGASAIYGADGLAGAVNMILRKNFNGFEVNATLDTAPGVNNPTANLAWGKSWERGSVSLIGTFQETSELLGSQREPTSSTSLPANLPASIVSAIANYSCAPGNVYSLDGSNLPGLSSPYAAIPAGITGKPTIAQFLATAGKQNLCNGNQYVTITPEAHREGALLSAHYELAPSADLFTEVLFSYQHFLYDLGPQISVSQFFGGTLSASNPYNPFGEAVNVSFAYPGAGTPEDSFTSLIRPLIGLRGEIFSGWHYEATATVSRTQFHNEYSIADPGLIANALASSTPATALNPFTTGAPGTSQLLRSLTTPADVFPTSFDDRTVRAEGFLGGPLVQLPAGPLQTVFGGEYSQQTQDENAPPYPALDLHRNAFAVFGEARVPLLADRESTQQGDRLTLTLAGRYDHSDDYGGKTTWQSGLRWRATESLSFRGGYGQSYRAPLLSQISGPQTVTPDVVANIVDPFRGNQLTSNPVTLTTGPNPNLKPETGDAFTLGLQYVSQALPGLHATLTWYDLKITDYIGIEATQTLVSYPSLFPGAVVRAPPTPQDQQLGYLGAITQINYLDYNFGDLRVAGFDSDVSYAIDTRAGQFTPSVAIAEIYKWQSALLPGTPTIDGVSQATLLGVGWSPRWKGTAALAWKQGPLSMNLAGRYIGKYRDYQDYGVANNTNEIGNTWIFDLNAHYEVGQALAGSSSWLAQSYVAFGAVNLFNKIPPLSYTPYWYDPAEYDIRGRYFHLSVGVRF
jgi:iron complex outermembrane recepter protein